MRWHLALTAALLFATPTIVHAKSVHSEFEEAWTARWTRYGTEQNAEKADLEAAAKDFFSNDSQDPAVGDRKLKALLDATNEFGFATGRLQLLQDALQFMDKKPSAARAELWIQEKINSLGNDQKQATARFEKLKTYQPEEIEKNPQAIIAEMGEAVFWNAIAKGQLEELTLLNDNLAIYYQAKSQQDAEKRAKWRAILGAMGQSLEQNSNRGFMMNCNTVGMTTNCMGM